MTSVLIRGDGVAAFCCAHLLGEAGFAVGMEPTDRPRIPALMLSDHALALIRDIFGNPDLLRDGLTIRKRMVAWGQDAKPLAVEHSGVVISEEALLEKLRTNAAQHAAIDWTIFASRPLPSACQEHRFGSRMASVARVVLKDDSEPQACWIESLEDGWLFLLGGWLLSVGCTAESLLSRSRVIVEQIAQASPAAGEFPAYPRIASPLSGARWLACGTAAMGFDPLCGDGTAHAIREAILATAVIQAISKGGSSEEILRHYEARLIAGFRRHLTLSREFYSSGGNGEWWKTELGAIEKGIAWCDRKLRQHGAFRYKLSGFELQRVS